MTRPAPAPPCTLGTGPFDHVPHPGAVIGYEFHGHLVPLSFRRALPLAELTEVREREFEDQLATVADQAASATGENPALTLDALRKIIEGMRG